MLNYKLIRSVIVLKTGLGLETGLKTSPFFEGLVLVSQLRGYHQIAGALSNLFVYIINVI